MSFLTVAGLGAALAGAMFLPLAKTTKREKHLLKKIKELEDQLRNQPLARPERRRRKKSKRSTDDDDDPSESEVDPIEPRRVPAGRDGDAADVYTYCKNYMITHLADTGEEKRAEIDPPSGNDGYRRLFEDAVDQHANAFLKFSPAVEIQSMLERELNYDFTSWQLTVQMVATIVKQIKYFLQSVEGQGLDVNGIAEHWLGGEEIRRIAPRLSREAQVTSRITDKAETFTMNSVFTFNNKGNTWNVQIVPHFQYKKYYHYSHQPPVVLVCSLVQRGRSGEWIELAGRSNSFWSESDNNYSAVEQVKQWLQDKTGVQGRKLDDVTDNIFAVYSWIIVRHGARKNDPSRYQFCTFDGSKNYSKIVTAEMFYTIRELQTINTRNWVVIGNVEKIPNLNNILLQLQASVQ